ncbi:hypothetical protein Hypma_001938 [Hypsizygus marmoreus]|uniref:Uncharacterized protein n=1 Tax=Hypsizygus marmoreus TaxID=39966 RepID=A0A369JEK9_HYPMA|nr:hypothetical protein Hypma_001938 [Hypsizygus marmoreus]
MQRQDGVYKVSSQPLGRFFCSTLDVAVVACALLSSALNNLNFRSSVVQSTLDTVRIVRGFRHSTCECEQPRRHQIPITWWVRELLAVEAIQEKYML